MNKFDPGRMEPFKYKLALFKDLFNVHLTEHPEDKEEAISIFSGLINEGKDLLTEDNIDAIKDTIDGWQLEIFKDENIEKIKESIKENEELDEDVISDEEKSMIDVPVPDRNFAMAGCRSPITEPPNSSKFRNKRGC